MAYLKEEALTKVNIQAIAQFFVLAGLATTMPFYIHQQWITGPMINAILILTLFLVGIRSALIVCLVPSLIALSNGLLPIILAPAVPFIMISNTILVLTIDWCYQNLKNNNQGYWFGLVVGAGLKFLFLFVGVKVLSYLLIKHSLTVKVAQMMSWPQFITALLGGIIAWFILKLLKKF